MEHLEVYGWEVQRMDVKTVHGTVTMKYASMTEVEEKDNGGR